MKLRRKSNGELVELDTEAPLGKGGEAQVYTLPSETQWAAKIYHKPSEIKARKLAVMLSHPPYDPTATRSHYSIAWPLDLLTLPQEPENVIGYLMPRVEKARPSLHYYNPMLRRRDAPLFNYLYLYRTARNLISVIHALHESGYVVGDLNQSNILVTESALVTVVDTDSFQVRDPSDGTLYLCPVGRPEYTPPEMQRHSFAAQDRNKEQDYFGMAVLVFQLLMEGTHPFAGLYLGEDEPPSYEERILEGHYPFTDEPGTIPYRPLPAAPPLSLLPPRVKSLFTRCFERGHLDPQMRPNTQTWTEVLEEAESMLEVCAVNDQHYYGNHLPHCPWCERAARLGGRDPFPSRRSLGVSPAPRTGSAATARPTPVAAASVAMPAQSPPRPVAPPAQTMPPPIMPAVVTAQPYTAPASRPTPPPPSMSPSVPVALTGDPRRAAPVMNALPSPTIVEEPGRPGLLLRESTQDEREPESVMKPAAISAPSPRRKNPIAVDIGIGVGVLALTALLIFLFLPKGDHSSTSTVSTSGTQAAPTLQSVTMIETAVKDGDNDTVTQLLSQYPALATHQDARGWTPLHFAAYYNRLMIVQTLLNKGADVNATEKTGLTPLQFAQQAGNTEIVRMLRAHGAK